MNTMARMTGALEDQLLPARLVGFPPSISRDTLASLVGLSSGIVAASGSRRLFFASRFLISD
jgi:hypothetical protein